MPKIYIEQLIVILINIRKYVADNQDKNCNQDVNSYFEIIGIKC